jgi:hypothetical protein
MRRTSVLLGYLLFVTLPPAAAAFDAFPDRGVPPSAGDDGKHLVKRLLDVSWDTLKAVRKGTFDTDFAPIHYRMGTKSLKTNFERGIFDTQIQLGYNGKLKLETSWPSLSGHLSFNVTSHPNDSAVYMFQFRQQF